MVAADARCERIGGLGLIGAVTMLAIYTIVCFVLMNSSFKLIELLPAGALEWIGGRGGADGGDAEHTGAVAVGGIGRVGGFRVGRGGGTARKPAGGGEGVAGAEGDKKK